MQRRRRRRQNVVAVQVGHAAVRNKQSPVGNVDVLRARQGPSAEARALRWQRVGAHPVDAVALAREEGGGADPEEAVEKEVAQVAATPPAPRLRPRRRVR